MSDLRTGPFGVRPVLLVLLVAVICAYALVRHRQQSGPAPPPGADNLEPLPSPDASRFDSLIQEQIAKVQAEVEDAPLDPSANVRLGMVYHAQSLLAAARVCYRRAIALVPDDFEAQYFLALACEQAGDVEAALAACQRATDLDPSYAPAWLLLGKIRWSRNELDQAEAIFARLAGEDLRLAAAHYWRGRVYAKRSQLDAAVEDFDKALALVPDNADVHYALAMALRDRGQMDRAAGHLRRYQEGRRPPLYEDVYRDRLNRLRTGADYEFQLALKLVEQGWIEESVEHYLRALRIDPQLAEAHQNLGVVFLRLGQPDKAVEWEMGRKRSRVTGRRSGSPPAIWPLD